VHERPVLIHPGNVLPLGEELHEAGDEQRVAFCLPRMSAGSSAGKSFGAKTHVEGSWRYVTSLNEPSAISSHRLCACISSFVSLQDVIANL